jgi:2'-5' RNA ligase
MRLFVAIELTDRARAAIAREQERVADAIRARGRRAPRVVDPEHMHLTLAFIGEVPEARAQPIVAAFSMPIPRPPFSIAFGGLGVFPPRGAPHVLWIGVAEGAQDLIDVQKIVASRLAEVGVPPEPRPYHPHLTLARWKDSRPSDRPPGDERTPAVVARIDVGAVSLFQSQLSSKAPTYTVLATARLAAS